MAAMASSTDSELSPALLKVATHVYRFPLPATKVILFTKCFADNLGADETSKTISSMEQAREDLALELASGTPNYSNSVAGAVRYCPLIAHVLRSLEKAEEPVYLQEPLSFTWATGLGLKASLLSAPLPPHGPRAPIRQPRATYRMEYRTRGMMFDSNGTRRPRQDWVTNQAVVWDKCMVLAAQALCYADTVYNMLEDSQGSKFTEAGLHLRKAAGLFQRLNTTELPRWVGETAKAPRLVEVEPTVCEGLVHFCLAEAQQMAIGKALVGGKTPKTLLARLCGGVVRMLEDSVSAMRRGGSSSVYERLDSPFLVHIAFQQSMFKALAYRFVAETAWAKDEHGIGVAYMAQASESRWPYACRLSVSCLGGSLALLSLGGFLYPTSRWTDDACKRVEERRDATSPGLPPLSPALRNIHQELHSLQGEFRDLRNSYLKDNNSIYYDPVPEFDMLDPLPEPVMMMKPLPSEEEPPPTILLSFRPTSTAEAETEGNGPEGSTTTADKAGGGGSKTDEEIARALHEKLNT
eukprot:jgi/Undpi1/4174/HiC_scaffold_16.g07541.m1